jgi:hypothetical protein
MAVDNPAAVRIVNLGFNNADDSGRDSLPATYNKAAEQVTAVYGIQALPNLIGFMAANGPLAGHLSLSGCTSLEYVECFGASVSSVDLSGCDSLIRICFEDNNLSYLDLNPVRMTLRDLRAATQQGGTLTLEPLEGPMAALWHFCYRSQVLINMPSHTNLPVIEQLWIWNCALTGTVKALSSVTMDSVIVASPSSDRPELENTITTLDVRGNTWGGGSRLSAHEINTLTTVLLDTAATAAFPRTVRLNGSNLSRATVDSIITTVNGWGGSNGQLDIQNTKPPSVSVGQPAITALRGRGWTVNTDTPEEPVTYYWEDTFERPDGAPGSPWVTPALGTGTPVASITSGRLYVTGGSSYQRCWAMPSGVTNNDHEVEIVFQGTPSAMTYFGICLRMNSDGTGAKVLFPSPGDAPRGGVATAATGTTMGAQSALPASWSTSGSHTLKVQAQGTQLRVYCDGVYAFAMSSSAHTSAGNGAGICGQLHNFSIDSIVIRPLP